MWREVNRVDKDCDCSITKPISRRCLGPSKKVDAQRFTAVHAMHSIGQ
ncbi:hypothetical protein SAMN05443551_3025 [Marivita hallyeonensis]|uniref:Uncharacterized protein n=1 Tax=Marivita hallyeonensis TaxID=996342 RepID=A0A1M5VR88_9RHOB|nr:hypothetical protein SAMN05443551_3025 [Marivita hallyeonensis]